MVPQKKLKSNKETKPQDRNPDADIIHEMYRMVFVKTAI